MNVTRILFLTIFFVPLIVYYIYYRIGQFLKYYQRYSKKRTFLFSIVFILTMISLTTIVSIIFLFLLLCSLILDFLFFFSCFFFKKSFGQIFNKCYQSGIIVVILTLFMIGYGYWNAHFIRQTVYQVETNKKLSKDEMTVVQISDLHFGVTLNVEKLEKEIQKINQQHPDLVVLTGDIFDENTTKLEMKQASKCLGSLESTYGIYYILGNHDSNHYARDKKYTEKELLIELKNNHIEALIDEVVNIHDDFYLIGRKDFSLGQRKSIENLTKGIDLTKYVILLDHQPVEFSDAQNFGIDLQFSGHTHAGQIFPLGLFMDLAKIYLINYGKYQSQNYTLIVSSGMGGWNYPLRTSKYAEYVVVKIKG